MVRASLPRSLLNAQRHRPSSRHLAVVTLVILAAGCGAFQGTPLGPLTVATLASALDIPWAMAFTPDGRLFFTERAGRLRVISGGVLQSAPVITLPTPAPGGCPTGAGEGGALGPAVDPNFGSNRYLYVYWTFDAPGGRVNRVQRLVVSSSSPFIATQDLMLVDNIPGLCFHDGGRLKIGPDGMLYATTGDAGNTSLSQDPSSLAGKILRMTPTGTVPPDNPTPGSYVYTLGHRNPQGLAWDASGAMYATEHGPTSNDEVNHILRGRNYGWPTIVGRGGDPRFIDPIFLFFPDTCAPSGATFVTGALLPEWNGDLLFACLRGAHLHRLRLAGPGSDTVVASEQLFTGTYGRMRDVVIGPDGAAYVATGNGGADQLLRIAR